LAPQVSYLAPALLIWVSSRKFNSGETMPSNGSLEPIEDIATKIYFIRGQKIMLDSDLAELYGVKTKYLIKQVNRNSDRFPVDFMFSLNNKEVTRLRFQIGTSKGRGGRRNRPYAFTEQGVAMLSGMSWPENSNPLKVNTMPGSAWSLMLSAASWLHQNPNDVASASML